MWLKVAIVLVGLSQVSASCFQFDHCDACPVPRKQCLTCGSGEVMSTDKTKCLACPTDCETPSCRYNDATKKAECVDSTCQDSFVLNDGHPTCAGGHFCIHTKQSCQVYVREITWFDSI
ncbi:hypothetical protein LSAT2_032154 [Lamellibrachia satsuma]|nr:hypothetical protein LSAT2_032154 [Lamellibrachia satsuma]